MLTPAETGAAHWPALMVVMYCDDGACCVVWSRNGCKYFIYGKGSKSGECYWEKTKAASCPDGWEDDSYDFYSISEGEASATIC